VIEFTILLDDSELEFEPANTEPELAFVLPPTARIGHPSDPADSSLHLAPIPVHCFLNAIYFGHWLSAHYGLNETDSFLVYTMHDMFKGLLNIIDQPVSHRGRAWNHQKSSFFDPIEPQLRSSGLFNDFQSSFEIATWHNTWLKGTLKHKWGKRLWWHETTTHEQEMAAGSVKGTLPLLGLTIRLQSALSNALSIAYVKRLFVESYVEAIRSEYPNVCARFDSVSYEYEFIDPAILTGDIAKDIEASCRQSKVYTDGQRLVIRTFIGAHGPHWKPGQETRIRLPFWLLLTLREDPVSILFPVPMLRGGDDNPAGNPAFIDRVREGFHQRVRDLLIGVKLNKTKQAKWSTRVDEIMAAIDDTFHITQTTVFDEAVSARQVDRMLATETCSMCSSPVPVSFLCSPVADLGASVSNYTDWHLGNADRACVLCAISHFKPPDALEPAKKLIFQRKVVYFATSTPSARKSSEAGAILPFFTATEFKPRLEIRSLESLVTLNVVAALYLHDALRRAVHYRDGERDLWLEETFLTGPFSFVGEVAKAKNKVGMPSFLSELFGSLNHPITLLDPLLPMRVEVPFHTLTCLWGVSKGRHYQFKYKPLIVSNETATLPVIWEGYHFIDRQTLTAIEELRLFVETFRHPKVSHRMKLTALASSPEELIETLIELGGFNYETVLGRLMQLSGGSDAGSYLRRLRELVVQTPLITEIWE
jgi:hypothetical protein